MRSTEAWSSRMGGFGWALSDYFYPQMAPKWAPLQSLHTPGGSKALLTPAACCNAALAQDSPRHPYATSGVLSHRATAMFLHCGCILMYSWRGGYFSFSAAARPPPWRSQHCSLMEPISAESGTGSVEHRTWGAAQGLAGQPESASFESDRDPEPHPSPAVVCLSCCRYAQE